MARCDYCGTRILFGGLRDGSRRFCNENCQQEGTYLRLADQLPADLVARHVAMVHEGECPKCGGRGPVEIHTSYLVWSVILMTSWRSTPQLCCQTCGTKAKLRAILICCVAGWWGFPWGLLATPIQILRNLHGLISSPDPMRPSEQLEKAIRLNLAAQVAEGGSAEGDLQPSTKAEAVA